MRLPVYWLVTVAGIASVLGGCYIQLKAQLAQVLLEHAWQQTKESSRLLPHSAEQFKPWPWADTHPAGELRVPDLNQRWIVLAGGSGRNLAFAPVWLTKSARPGEEGISIVSAHKDTHFEPLKNLRIGDTVTWQSAYAEQVHFTLVHTDIVDAEKTLIDLDAYSASERWLVLSTCYPFDDSYGGPLRKLFYLKGSRVAAVPEKNETREQHLISEFKI